MPLQEQKKSGALSFTIVFDDYVYKDSLQPSKGFSCLIEGLEKTILFDTGADGDILLKNMEMLDIDPQKIEMVVVSHDHWDHTGGLEQFLIANAHVKVYLLKSFSQTTINAALSAADQVHLVTSPRQCCKNAYSTGALGEHIPEQSLVIETSRGLILITGCAHPGIVEIVETVKKQFNQDIFLAFGGFHLKNKTETEMDSVIMRLQENNVARVGPTHCTGDHAIEKFKKAYGDQCLSFGVGKTLTIR